MLLPDNQRKARSNRETRVSTMVEPETFTFLADLAMNNRKAWMDEHRAERDDALRNFTGIAITLHNFADRFDPFVAQAQIKPKLSEVARGEPFQGQ